MIILRFFPYLVFFSFSMSSWFIWCYWSKMKSLILFHNFVSDGYNLEKSLLSKVFRLIFPLIWWNWCSFLEFLFILNYPNFPPPIKRFSFKPLHELLLEFFLPFIRDLACSNNLYFYIYFKTYKLNNCTDTTPEPKWKTCSAQFNFY